MLHEQQPNAPGTVSRRKLIITGASLAAAGMAVGAAATIPLSANDDAPGLAAATPEKPVMVHLRDATDGTFDVFVGTDRVQLTDRAFAARLAKAVTAL